MPRPRSLLDLLVLGIPRGGAVVAAALARALGGTMDLVLAAKIRAPYNPEVAIGAVGEDGKIYVVPAGRLEAPEGWLARQAKAAIEEIRRRREAFRALCPAERIAGRSVIVTDDGIATGATMIAALIAVAAQGPGELLAAVPVAPPDRLREVARHADETVCLATPEDFTAVGEFYEEFAPVPEERVAALLDAAGRKSPEPLEARP